VSEPSQSGLARLVLDPNVLVAAAISSQGPPTLLLQLVGAGAAVMVVSPLLLQELREVLRREKFRRWLAVEDVEEYIEAVALLAEEVPDPPSEGLTPVCRDPDDDYLVFLAEDVQATLLVSGDKDLLSLRRPGLDVRSPRNALDGLLYEHPWGPGLMPADQRAAWAQAVGEGHDQVLQVAAEFVAALEQRNVKQLLLQLVTPESLGAWRRGVVSARAAVAARGMTNRPEYPAANVAFVKLPPDPGETVKARGSLLLPDTKILTLLRRPGSVDPAPFGGWRVHLISDHYPPLEELPVPPDAGT